MQAGKRLVVGCAIVVGVSAYMAYLGASSSWQYYLTAEECVARSDTLVGDRLRVSGKVATDSLHVSADRGQAAFTLEATPEPLRVNCAGPLPDNLAEGIDVVVEGRLDAKGLLRGDKVLTRCASKYESHEAKPGTKDIAGRDAKSRL